MACDENEYKVNKKLKRFPKIDELLVYDDNTDTYEVIWTQRNIDAITNIVKIVVNKHFSNSGMQDEYISHALTKVVDVLISNEFDYKNYGTTTGLKNFLYTVARNSLTDYTYHYANPNKECFYDAIPESTDVSKVDIEFTEADIDKYLKYYKRKFPLLNIDFDKAELVFLIKAMGFPVKARYATPKPGHEYALEKCLALFPKYYFKNKF